MTITFVGIDLQLFADGGAGAGGAGAASGVSAPAAGEQSGVYSPAAGEGVEVPEVTDRRAEFDRLRKGEYKDLFSEWAENTVQQRLKSTKADVDAYHKLTPLLETLARKHGVDSTDIDGIIRAVDEDDSYYEQEALERGMTVEQLKSVRKMERENGELRRQIDEQHRQQAEAERRAAADQIYQTWMSDAESLKQMYPTFDFEAEMQNPKFQDLLRSNIDVRTAFEVVHKDELLYAGMQATAKAVEQSTVNKIRANAARPVENGLAAQAAPITVRDISAMTKAQRQDYIRRAAAGEKITFKR